MAVTWVPPRGSVSRRAGGLEKNLPASAYLAAVSRRAGGLENPVERRNLSLSVSRRAGGLENAATLDLSP